MITRLLARIRQRVHKKNFFMNKNPDYADYQIGDWTYGYPIVMTKGRTSGTLNIGKFCSIGPNVKFVLNTTQYRPAYESSTVPVLPDGCIEHACADVCGDITIGNDVWIGSQAVIMPGVTLGDGCVIGARTYVVKDVPPYAIVIGNPNRVITYRWSPEQIEQLLRLRWWDWPIQKIEDALPYILSEDIEAFLEQYGDM